jgi:cellulose synthase/poly-beta-1,6-N-acetylglucosamine synthase-like glycosyltransferase
MKMIFFLIMVIVSLGYLFWSSRRRPSRNFMSVDVVVPAYNEEPAIEGTLISLLRNRYVRRVICVNDGSTDGTAQVVAALAQKTPRLLLINQKNTGKGGALMHGLEQVETKYVFLTDADTQVEPKGDDLGYLIDALDRGKDAVGGIPSTNLDHASGPLPYIRAAVKLPMIAVQRTFQQVLGGGPFVISGACGMFRSEVLRTVGFSDRTKVEDLDLTWSLVAAGYKIGQVNKCVVYTEEASGLGDEVRRWRRWIAGYGVCMRLHRNLIFTRYGIFTIIPMFLLGGIGIASYSFFWTRAVMVQGAGILPMLAFPMVWLSIISIIGSVSAVHHRRPWLIFMAPLALFHVFLAYFLWLKNGLPGIVTGREPNRDKPTRYARVVA